MRRLPYSVATVPAGAPTRGLGTPAVSALSTGDRNYTIVRGGSRGDNVVLRSAAKGVTGWPTREGPLMGYRVVVDFDRCSSTAICMGLAPEVFEVRDDNCLYVLQEEPSDELRAKVEMAAKSCPTQAISIEET